MEGLDLGYNGHWIHEDRVHSNLTRCYGHNGCNHCLISLLDMSWMVGLLWWHLMRPGSGCREAQRRYKKRLHGDIEERRDGCVSLRIEHH